MLRASLVSGAATAQGQRRLRPCRPRTSRPTGAPPPPSLRPWSTLCIGAVPKNFPSDDPNFSLTCDYFVLHGFLLRLATCGSQRLSKVLDSTRRHGTGLAETLTRLDGTTTELDSRLTRFATRRTARRLADSTRLDSSSTAWPRHRSLATTQARW